MKYVRIPMPLVEAAIIEVENKETAGMMLREYCLIVCGEKRQTHFDDPYYEAALNFAFECTAETSTADDDGDGKEALEMLRRKYCDLACGKDKRVDFCDPYCEEASVLYAINLEKKGLL